jgi:hypothetical protein
MFHRSFWILTALITAIALNGGCSQNNSSHAAVAAANDSNVKRLSNLYQSFASRHGWRGPKDEAEFKEFIRNFPAHRLEMMGVGPDQLDTLFVSEIDGQPFQVKYEIKSGLGAVIPVVFEQQGEGGKRMVGFTNGSVQVADESLVRQLLDGVQQDGTKAQ